MEPLWVKHFQPPDLCVPGHSVLPGSCLLPILTVFWAQVHPMPGKSCFKIFVCVGWHGLSFRKSEAMTWAPSCCQGQTLTSLHWKHLQWCCQSLKTSINMGDILYLCQGSCWIMGHSLTRLTSTKENPSVPMPHIKLKQSRIRSIELGKELANGSKT